MARSVVISLLASPLVSSLPMAWSTQAPSSAAFVCTSTHVCPCRSSLLRRGSPGGCPDNRRALSATSLDRRENPGQVVLRLASSPSLRAGPRGRCEKESKPTFLDDEYTVTYDSQLHHEKNAQSRRRSSNDSNPVTLCQQEYRVLVDAAAAAAVAVAVGSFLAPSDAAAATTTSVELVSQATAVAPDIGAIVAKAGKASLGGGASGAAAAVIQVLSLMWLRTTMNFQYRNGGTTENALRTLWEEGGVPRLYRGLSFALVQGPLSRFGDTAANVGVLALLESFESTRSLPLPVKSAAGSFAAGLWRIGLTPIDAYKTTLQVSGAEGIPILTKKIAANGPGVLFEGALATATATFVGHYPWYFTYNSLGAWLPPAPAGDTFVKLGRQAFLGLCSSCVSDCCSNSIRVVKTTKQTAPVPISYPEALKQVVDEDGPTGLFVRGLQTRIIVNALQGALFAVAWKYFEELLRTGGLS